MLGDITAAGELYIVTGYIDMRKSIDGLCAIVEDQLHMDPRRSALYLFCGKRCDRVKPPIILYHYTETSEYSCAVGSSAIIHFLNFPTYLSFASNNCFLQCPYIVRFIIFNRLFVPSTKPLL